MDDLLELDDQFNDTEDLFGGSAGTDQTDGPTAEPIGPDTNQADIVNGSADVTGSSGSGGTGGGDAGRSASAGIAYPDAKVGVPDYTDLTKLGSSDFLKVAGGVVGGLTSLAHNAMGGNASSLFNPRATTTRPQSSGVAPRGLMGLISSADGKGGYAVSPVKVALAGGVVVGGYFLYRRFR